VSARLDVSMRLCLGDRFELEFQLEQALGVLAFFGPSGSGKTLALRSLVGLIRPTEGTLRFDGELWVDTSSRSWVPPHLRRVGYVPQTSALFPHLSVRENVCFGLDAKSRRDPPGAVVELMERLDIRELASEQANELSGGERQRVALARALAREPNLLLLDEPMSAIDVAARQALRDHLSTTIADLQIPTVLVTHDPREAIALASEALVFERGRPTRSISTGDLLVNP